MSRESSSHSSPTTGSAPSRKRKRRTFGWTHVKKACKPSASEKEGMAKPPKFSWVVEGLLAAHGRPTKPGHLDYLVKNGINVLVTLTENKPTVMDRHKDKVSGLKWVHIPVKDEKPPGQEQVKQFVATVEKCKQDNKVASVHCAWGRGRTGTMLACYLVKSKSLSASAAIEQVRQMRPGSIDTQDQENVVTEYYTSLKKR